jgi:hypothetical protein
MLFDLDVGNCVTGDVLTTGALMKQHICIYIYIYIYIYICVCVCVYILIYLFATNFNDIKIIAQNSQVMKCIIFFIIKSMKSSDS